MQVSKTRLNLITILGVWTVAMFVLTPVFMFISNVGASGGEQKPLTTLVNMLIVTIYGAAIFSILTGEAPTREQVILEGNSQYSI